MQSSSMTRLIGPLSLRYAPSKVSPRYQRTIPLRILILAGGPRLLRTGLRYGLGCFRRGTAKTNFIEHPELVAQRIGRYARLVDRENVIAGSDCGYGTWVGQAAVDPDIVWAKFAALTEGARIASERFWR